MVARMMGRQRLIRRCEFEGGRGLACGKAVGGPCPWTREPAGESAVSHSRAVGDPAGAPAGPNRGPALLVFRRHTVSGPQATAEGAEPRPSVRSTLEGSARWSDWIGCDS